MKIIKPQEKEWIGKQGHSEKIFLDKKYLGNSGSLVQEIKIKTEEVADAHYYKKQ